MTVESFLFRVDRLQELYGLSRQQVFRDFHLLLEGAATKWYWQLMEDKAEVYDFDYYSLTQKIRRNRGIPDAGGLAGRGHGGRI